MNKQYRSYSDHEIANYVLGIELPENTAKGIQHNLASDDAAAARALKWEAYFLSLVDGLEPIKPETDNLEKIQASLNIKILTDADSINSANKSPDELPASQAHTDEISECPKPKNKLKLTIGILIILIIGFIAWASLKAPVESSTIQQDIDLRK